MLKKFANGFAKAACRLYPELGEYYINDVEGIGAQIVFNCQNESLLYPLGEYFHGLARKNVIPFFGTLKGNLCMYVDEKALYNYISTNDFKLMASIYCSGDGKVE